MRRSKPQLIEEVMQNLIKELGLEKGLKEVKIYTTFDELVGTRITNLVTKKYMSNRKLVVHLKSSIARSELMMIRNELAAEINRKLGEQAIDGIILS